MSLVGTDSEKYDPQQKGYDQIFTFILCKSVTTPLTSIVKKANEVFGTKDKYVNIILPIEGNAITYLNRSENCFVESAMNATDLCELSDDDVGFNYFITKLLYQIEHGRSVPLNTQRYIQSKSSFNVSNIISL